MISVGVALAVPGEPFPDLVQRADAALFRAKEAGRNTVSA
jgi:PleD family two-component response regulator